MPDSTNGRMDGRTLAFFGSISLSGASKLEPSKVWLLWQDDPGCHIVKLRVSSCYQESESSAEPGQMAPWLVLAPVSLDESMFTCAGVVFSEVAVAILSWQRYTAAGPRQLQARLWRRNQCA